MRFTPPFRWGGVVATAILLAGCAAGPAPQPSFVARDAVLLPVPVPVATGAGAYLSAYVATRSEDDATALGYDQRALAAAPADAALAHRVFVLGILEGREDVSLPMARRILALRPQDPLAALVLAIDAVRRGDGPMALRLEKDLPADGYAHYAGIFVRAWAQLADGPRFPADRAAETAALAELAALDGTAPAAGIVQLHKALILDLADDPAAADAYLAALNSGGRALRWADLASNYLMRHGQRAAALDLYRRYLAAYGDPLHMLQPPQAAIPGRLVGTAAQGLGEALFDLAGAAGQNQRPEVTLLGIRLALLAQPDLTLARFVLAGSLAQTDRQAAAQAVLAGIPPDSRYGWAARFTRAQFLVAVGNDAPAVGLLRGLEDETPGSAEVAGLLGDALRGKGDFAAAADSYGKAIDLNGNAAPVTLRSTLYFSRGISRDHSDQWAGAEADLRQALALTPDQPEILNYLGYAMLVRHVTLPEAMSLIQRAARMQPDSADIVDSLGWAYFSLNDYAKAEATLERAVLLRPSDPEINDHLGDAYWKGGHRDEARRQWQRALSLAPSSKLAQAINAKLDR